MFLDKKLNRVNRIFVYCVPTFCVLRTVSPLPNTAYQGGGDVTLVLDVKKNSGFSLYTSCLHQLIHWTWCTQTILTKIAISIFFHFYFSGFAQMGSASLRNKTNEQWPNLNVFHERHIDIKSYRSVLSFRNGSAIKLILWYIIIVNSNYNLY